MQYANHRSTRLVLFCMGLICSVAFLNLNGLSVMLLSVDRLFSPLYLVAAVVILLVTGLRISSVPLTVYVFAVLNYLLVGMLNNVDFGVVSSVLNGALIVTSTATATNFLSSNNELKRFFFLSSICAYSGAAAIYLSPLLPEAYNAIESARMSSEGGRWLGLFANPNGAGFSVVYAVAFLISGALSTHTSERGKFLFSILGIGIFPALVLTLSRGAIIVFFLLILVSIVFSNTNQERRLISSKSLSNWALFGVFGLLVFWFLSGGYKDFDLSATQMDRLGSIERILTFERNIRDTDTGGRQNLAEIGMEMFWEKPLMGHGLGELHVMSETGYTQQGCHNTHLMVAGESGIVGSSVYFLFIGIMGLEILRLQPSSQKLFCALVYVIFLFEGMVSHNVLEGRNMNVMLGIAIGLLSTSQTVYRE